MLNPLYFLFSCVQIKWHYPWKNMGFHREVLKWVMLLLTILFKKYDYFLILKYFLNPFVNFFTRSSLLTIWIPLLVALSYTCYFSFYIILLTHIFINMSIPFTYLNRVILIYPYILHFYHSIILLSACILFNLLFQLFIFFPYIFLFSCTYLFLWFKQLPARCVCQKVQQQNIVCFQKYCPFYFLWIDVLKFQ